MRDHRDYQVDDAHLIGMSHLPVFLLGELGQCDFLPHGNSALTSSVDEAVSASS